MLKYICNYNIIIILKKRRLEPRISLCSQRFALAQTPCLDPCYKMDKYIYIYITQPFLDPHSVHETCGLVLGLYPLFLLSIKFSSHIQIAHALLPSCF